MTDDPSADTAVRLDEVRFIYERTSLRFDVSFQPGAITAVMGASGSGKSTLLNLVAGFEVPQSGRVLIGQEDVTTLAPADRPVSMMFQENNLFAHLDVERNVALGRSPSLRLTNDDRKMVGDALARTGLSGKERRLPRELSGGERQRVALARVLVRNRPVLLLDEPFGSLGPALRADMLDLLRDVQAEREMTVLLVTHQPEDARRIASHIVFLEAGSVVASDLADNFFADGGPEAFRHYIGEKITDSARKRT